MTIEIKITELTHKDLVTLFSTALYGNASMGARVAKNSLELRSRICAYNLENNLDNCREDIWADVLQSGGCIELCDFEAECDDEPYGFNHQEVFYDEEHECMCYVINLNDLLKGLSNEDAYKYLNETLNGDGDLYDAWNALQVAVFGEEIYG